MTIYERLVLRILRAILHRMCLHNFQVLQKTYLAGEKALFNDIDTLLKRRPE